MKDYLKFWAGPWHEFLISHFGCFACLCLAARVLWPKAPGVRHGVQQMWVGEGGWWAGFWWEGCRASLWLARWGFLVSVGIAGLLLAGTLVTNGWPTIFTTSLMKLDTFINGRAKRTYHICSKFSQHCYQMRANYHTKKMSPDLGRPFEDAN